MYSTCRPRGSLWGFWYLRMGVTKAVLVGWIRWIHMVGLMKSTRGRLDAEEVNALQVEG